MRKNINFNDDVCKRIEENARILGLDVTTEFNQTLLYGIMARTKRANDHEAIMESLAVKPQKKPKEEKDDFDKVLESL